MRYGAPTIECMQGSEHDELMRVLPSPLITRQGLREHWTADNTTMHRVRSVHGVIVINEVDFLITYLCSGFSYVITVLGTIYVWHGRGSLPSEQAAAMSYAQSLLTTELILNELREGDEDEMFWMILGDDFRSANYWKFRTEEQGCDPQVYEIVQDDIENPVQHRPRFSGQNMKSDTILVVDCQFELFLLIGPEARGFRKEIGLGLSFAEDIVRLTAYSRPFTSPVHVLILPSLLPVDLRAALPYLDETSLNNGCTPQHMNLLTLEEAKQHLLTSSWTLAQLSDETFLPLGLDKHAVARS